MAHMVKITLLTICTVRIKVRWCRKFSEKIRYQRCSLLIYPKICCELGRRFCHIWLHAIMVIGQMWQRRRSMVNKL